MPPRQCHESENSRFGIIYKIKSRIILGLFVYFTLASSLIPFPYIFYFYFFILKTRFYDLLGVFACEWKIYNFFKTNRAFGFDPISKFMLKNVENKHNELIASASFAFQCLHPIIMRISKCANSFSTICISIFMSKNFENKQHVLTTLAPFAFQRLC